MLESPELWLAGVILAASAVAFISRTGSSRPAPCTVTRPHARRRPIATDRWPIDVRMFFEETAVTLEQLGFQATDAGEVTDTVLPIYEQHFVHATDDVCAEVTLASGSLIPIVGQREHRAVTFISVFDDGVTLHTSNLDYGAIADADDPSNVFRYLPQVSPEDLYREHRDSVHAYVWNRRANVLPHVREVLRSRRQAERDLATFARRQCHAAAG